ncbi:MAG: 5-demethoxyubiquinol-8 5-hydroxylase UbiM [Burkholderiaceae bacterium]|nr:5-demethoxyubiquinol-8 5-hydroxylase UbiM [Burkholderiaceae bacterium]
MPDTHRFDADVLIVGAGPAGLALAAALADAGLHALVLERQPRDTLATPAEDGREIALTHRARSILQRLGWWERLTADDMAPLNEARVADGDAPARLRFGPGVQAPLGWLVPNHRLRAVGWAAAGARPRVTIETGVEVTALARDAAGATLTLADGRTRRAPLVVAADSRFSAVRRLAGIGASMRDFGRSVVVDRVAHEAPNRGIAWECFRHGHTLALLPMNGGCSSAVVTLPSEQAPDWLALDDDGFAARVQAASGGVLGGLRATGPRHHYPLVGVYAQRFVGPRFALIGDAAVGMHPVTAHGFNFGLYGVEVLARELQRRRRALDLNPAPALAAYEAEHRRTTWPIYQGTNAVVSLFTDERPLARVLRPAVLALAGQAPGLRTLVRSVITRQLTGSGLPA